ncbi:hypothetical protein BH09PSE3_BH09PSE3_28360 [soil metagenome]
MRNSSQTGRSPIGLYLGIILIGANLRAPITSIGPVLKDIQHDLGLNGTAAGLLNALFFAFHSMVFYSIVDWFAAYAVDRGICQLSGICFWLTEGE